MGDSQQDSDGTPTGHATVSVAEAARRLGVTPDAIRSRLHRGTLEGEKVAGAWRVVMPAENPPSPPTGERQDADGMPTGQGSDRQDTTDSADGMRQDAATVDLAPLAETIDRLTRRNEELAAAVGMWQARAHHLEDQVRQLTPTAESTGQGSGEELRDATPAPEVERASTGLFSRLRRWLG
jgi:hypothetical protein